MKEYAWLHGIMADQLRFEAERVGTDGSLADYNSPEFILTRGIKGEADECLEALQAGQFAEAKYEAIDVLIFLASLFNHLDLTAEDVERIAHTKMKHNDTKYEVGNFEGRTIAEGMKLSRDEYEKKFR